MVSGAMFPGRSVARLLADEGAALLDIDAPDGHLLRKLGSSGNVVA
ncbi:MAG: hypothetical protein QOJ19_2555 [Acidimicrobiia bacterium]|jgi:hypothetical protein|nr:hypothetical protein [Acidimicrobiia bacterium]